MTGDLWRRQTTRSWGGGGWATLAVALAVVSTVLLSMVGPVRVATGAVSRSAPEPVSRWPVDGPLFRWPVDGPPRLVRPFDPPPRPWLPGHRGVDLAAAPGARVRAAGSGMVLFAGLVAGRPVVTVGHTDGLRTTYEPVHPTVRVGAPVVAGTPLGELATGHPGCPVSACLHWGLRRGVVYLDPLALLGPIRVRLLPVAESAPTLPVAASPPVPSVAASPPVLPVAASPPAALVPVGRGRSGSALGEQRWQAYREPLVLLDGVVDLTAEAQPTPAGPRRHGHLGGDPVGDPIP